MHGTVLQYLRCLPVDAAHGPLLPEESAQPPEDQGRRTGACDKTFSKRLKKIEAVGGGNQIELRYQDEMRVGQVGRTTTAS